MKKYVLTCILAVLGIVIPLHSQEISNTIEWFEDSKLGLFIHWGLYSQAAGEWKGKPTTGGEHFMLYEKIPIKEYEKIADHFNPSAFDAGKWVKTAKKAGIKYIVYTTKHHDGFAMYDSNVSGYTIVKRTAFGRDPLKELADACRKEGIKLGLYYSLGRDWHDPDVPTNWPEKAGRSNTWDYPDEDAKDLAKYFERKVKPQLTELLTNYGEITMMWFDTPELITKAQSEELRNMIHQLQPGCIINNRIGNGMGDYRIVEQKLTDRIDTRSWEACLTMGRNWGYNRFDTIYKTPEIILRSFTDIISKGGNLLLNVGPDGYGNFPEKSIPVFHSLEEWINLNKETVYGTHPWKVYGENLISGHTEESEEKAFHDAEYDGLPKSLVPDLRFTSKDDKIYIFVRSNPQKEFVVKSVTPQDKVKNVRLIGIKSAIEWEQDSSGLRIMLPDNFHTWFPVYTLEVMIGN